MLRLPNLQPQSIAPPPLREFSTRSINRAESRRPSGVPDGCTQYYLTEDDPLNTTFETPQKEVRYVVHTKGDPESAMLRSAKTRVGYWDPNNDVWEHVIGDIEWGGLARGDYVKSPMFEHGNGYKIKTEDLLFEHPELSKRCATLLHALHHVAETRSACLSTLLGRASSPSEARTLCGR